MSASALTSSIRVGIAGWSYPDWRGIVYARSPRGQEPLRIVSRLFDCVEINSTFYRDPDARLSATWADVVEDCPGFTFTAKMPRRLTHERHVDPAAIRSGGERVVAGLAPLVGAGRLETLLAQFPPWFHDRVEARDRVACIVDSVRPLHVAVEVRNPSFLEGVDGRPRQGRVHFLRFLEEIGAGFVNVDMPAGPGSIPPTIINTSATGYVRLHGRNARSWFDRGAGRDATYDYLYRESELREWVERIVRLAKRSLLTHVITNNHFQGQAPANALELGRLLGKPPPGIPIPAALVDRFPRLAGTDDDPQRRPSPGIEGASR